MRRLVATIGAAVLAAAAFPRAAQAADGVLPQGGRDVDGAVPD